MHTITFWIKWFALWIVDALVRKKKFFEDKWFIFWKDIRSIVWQGIRFLFSLPMLSLVAIVVIWLLYHHYGEVFPFPQNVVCHTHSLELHVYSPTYSAPGDILEFKVSLYNSSQSAMEDIEVGIIAEPFTALWFPQGNILHIKAIDGYTLWNSKIEAQVPTFGAPEEVSNINLRIFLHDKSEFTFCNDMILHFSPWRQKWVLLQRFPQWLDISLKVLGVLSAVLLAIITLFQKWGDFLNAIEKWVQR